MSQTQVAWAHSLVVVKIGSSSLTGTDGDLNNGAIKKLCSEIAALRSSGVTVLLVTSGAVSAGLPVLGMTSPRPTDLPTLQAAASVGQTRLMDTYNQIFATHGIVTGQVLLDSLDFVHRRQYLYARQTIERLLELNVLPLINENLAHEGLRLDGNDHLAALVAHLLRAEKLIILTDTDGLYTADPRTNADAQLIGEVDAISDELAAVAGGVGSEHGTGGMATKVRAAKIAAFSGTGVVIANSAKENVLSAALAGEPNVGTTVRPADKSLPARKLWIAFAASTEGRVVVDAGARRALVERGTSLLPAGVVSVEGDFEPDDCVDIADTEGDVFARGIARLGASSAENWIGKQTHELGVDTDVAVHRDDLVVLP